MPRYSKELLNYIGRRLGLSGRNLYDLSSRFDELPEVIQDNWLAGFGDIKADKFLRKSPQLVKHGEQAGLASDAAGQFIGPYLSKDESTSIPMLLTRTGAGPEAVLHEGTHNLDNALYSTINRTFDNSKSFFLPVFENTGPDITVGLPQFPLAAPLHAFGFKTKSRPDLVMSAISNDPHGIAYFSTGGTNLNWDKVAQEGIAQMLQRARPFSVSPAYRKVVEAVEANPLTRYDITFDNLFRSNSNIPENKPVFASRTGRRMLPKENSVYVDMLRQIPEEGIKPIDIKEKQTAGRPWPVSRAESRGQGSSHWQNLKDNGLIEMRNRRAYITNEGRRLLDELKRASEVQPDKVRYGGLYNE